jgi:hypothetical protein
MPLMWTNCVIFIIPMFPNSVTSNILFLLFLRYFYSYNPNEEVLINIIYAIGCSGLYDLKNLGIGKP